MFTKYMNKFQKAEAEWVLELLDEHDGDQQKARQAITDALERLTGNAEPIAELEAFDKTIRGCFFASRDWWSIGLKRLAELGLVMTSGPAEIFDANEGRR